MYLIIFASLIGTIQCANILGVFMYPSMSHQIVFQQIWQELSLRGHQVTVITPDPLNNSTLTNLTEISVRFAYDEVTKRNDAQNSNPYKTTEDYYNTLDAIAEKELNSPQFKRLIQDQTKKYDLILIEYTHPVMYALGHRFQAPVIAVSASEIPSASYDAVGNPNHPILYPEPILNFTPARLTLWQKCQSVLFFVWSKIYYHNSFVPRAHEMAKKYFGQDLPYIGDLERNVSMFFINRNLLLNPPRPNVPAIIEISPVDTKPPQTLPKDLRQILDEAREGVIYVNLGESAKLEQKRKNILLALNELPYKFLWKGEYDGDTPSNVIVRSSLPERDLLAHRNVKAFVTEGDMYSIEQAISNRVPIVCVTFAQNKPSYVKRVLKLGIGEKIDLSALTVTKLKNVIVKVAETKSYRNKIKKAQSILLDKPMTGLESAVWWAEYVIRHKGARHMRSYAVDMPMHEYLLLDVILFLILVITLVPYLSYCVVAKIIKKLMGRKKKDDKVKQN